MKRTLSIVFATALAAATLVHGQTTPTTATTDNAERLTTGQITKIDVKKKVLTVKTVSSDSNPTPSRQPQGGGGRRGGGGTRTGGRRGGGVGIPFPGTGGGRVPPSASKNQPKPFKVTVTDQTSIKDSENTIPFGLLRIGDRISIQGLPVGSGSDMKATQITVNR